MQIKRYRFNRAINFRDMGGVYAENDKIVRWNKLYRSDKFEGTTDDEWATMHKSGIKTILDMRSFKEVDISPDKCPDDFKYIHCPLVEEDLSFDNIDLTSDTNHKNSQCNRGTEEKIEQFAY